MKRSFLKKEIVSIVVKFNLNKAEEQIQIIKGLFFEVCFNVENKPLVCIRTGFIRMKTRESMCTNGDFFINNNEKNLNKKEKPKPRLT